MYNHITQAIKNKNGKATISALCTYYEEEDLFEGNIEQAFAALTNTFYKGEHKNFNFEKYVAVHLEAHHLLGEVNYNNGAGMDNAAKNPALKVRHQARRWTRTCDNYCSYKQAYSRRLPRICILHDC